MHRHTNGLIRYDSCTILQFTHNTYSILFLLFKLSLLVEIFQRITIYYWQCKSVFWILRTSWPLHCLLYDINMAQVKGLGKGRGICTMGIITTYLSAQILACLLTRWWKMNLLMFERNFNLKDTIYISSFAY